MAEQQRATSKQSRSKRDKQQDSGQGAGEAGKDQAEASYEKELAGYLQERIKPGLNSGAIPLLARSIAKDIAHRERPNGASGDNGGNGEPGAAAEDQPTAETDDEPTAETDDEPTAETDDEPTAQKDDEPSAQEDGGDEPSGGAGDDESDGPTDFEADMHDLQAELGKDWILRFSVQGGDAWLTAEKDDGSQRVEAPTAAVISEAVELLNEGGGRGS